MTYTHRLEVQRRQLTEQRRERLDQLLGKTSLAPVEKGELQALAREGTERQREQIRTRLAAGRGTSGGKSDQQVARDLGAAFGRAISRALDDGGGDDGA